MMILNQMGICMMKKCDKISIGTALSKMSALGIRKTPARIKVLEILCEAESPKSAFDILHRLQKDCRSINKTTVYRILQLMEKHQIIHPVYMSPESVRYELSSLPHHHHAQCTQCGQTRSVKSRRLEQTLRNIEQSLPAFTVTRHIVEFRGLCVMCKT